MRLERFSIQKYRSIIKAEKLPLGDLTVLVGPNNDGKSNILEALVVGMEELASPLARPRVRGRRKREHGGYFWERDFPQSLQPAEPAGRSIMDFDFALTSDEIDDFYGEVGSRLNGILPLRLSFGGNRPAFSVRKQRHSRALSAKREEIAGFVAHAFKYNTCQRSGRPKERRRSFRVWLGVNSTQPSETRSMQTL